MNEGSFSVCYLGVPLITKRLTAADCENLVSRITARIDSWLVKNLSFAGAPSTYKFYLQSSNLLVQNLYPSKEVYQLDIT